tara:strand:- start:213 stop:494 length:282 start_codon:yes stop_codon:yes gene_type:complete
MIVEFLLIVDLLRKTSSFGRSTPVASQPPSTPQAVKHTEGSGAGFVTDLFRLGKIEKITQPVTGVYITPREAAEAYLQAGTGRPEKIGTGGRF